jgi:hypothetical protein
VTAVRIENADHSGYKVLVQTWHKNPYPGQPDKKVAEVYLPNATDLGTFNVHSSQYLVIKEVL